jgi:hypothetical protein
LTQDKTRPLSVHLNAKEIMKRIKILEGKGSTELRNQAINSNSRGAHQYDIIHVNQQVNSEAGTPQNKQRCIGCRRGKPKASEHRTESSMPGTRGLLKPIESLIQPTQVARTRGILKTWRLSHKHLLLKYSM